MDEIQQYKIIYTKSATQDILEKADYIASELHENELALKWYHRLRQQLQKNLSCFPFMYPAYDREPWKAKGYRLLTTANDVVLYTVGRIGNNSIEGVRCKGGEDLQGVYLNNLPRRSFRFSQFHSSNYRIKLEFHTVAELQLSSLLLLIHFRI